MAHKFFIDRFRRIYLAILIVCLASISDSLIAQSSLIRYNVSNGLSQNSVTCIFKDAQGLLWIGTQDGLNRFDGYSFRHFKHNEKDSNSISDQYITSIAADGKGRLLVGTRNGLNEFIPSKQQFRRLYPNPESRYTIQYEFSHMELCSNGNLIINGGLDLYEWNCETRSLLILKKNLGLLQSFTVWKSEFIFLIDTSIVWNHPIDKLSTANVIPQIQENRSNRNQFIDRNDKCWLVKNQPSGVSQIFLFDLKKKKWERKSFLLKARVFYIDFDQKNTAWLSTQQGIILIDAQGNMKSFEVDGKPVQSMVLSTFTDNENLTWIGFANNGLALYNPHSSAFALQETGVSDDPVLSSVRHSDGNLWMGASSGIYIRNVYGQTLKKISSNTTNALAEGENGTVWAGVKGEGIVVYNARGEKIRQFNDPSLPVSMNAVFHIQYQKELKSYFISTPVGFLVYRADANQWNYFCQDTLLPASRQLAGHYVVHSFTDSKKRTWVSSNTGLDVLDENLNIILRVNSGSDTCPDIKRTIVTGVCEDLRKVIWISTLSNGIYAYENNRFSHFAETEGLSSNVVYGLCADKRGRIWIATTSGMNVLDPVTKRIHQLSQHDGIPMVDFSLSSMFYHPSGLIHVGSSEGLLTIKADEVEFEGKPLHTLIDNVLINFNPAEVQNGYQLSAGQRYFSVEISAPCFISPQKVIYQYRLKGYDDAWINLPAGMRRITFNNLPYGELLLEMRSAIGEDKLASAPLTVLKINHSAPFYRHPLFISLMLSLLILLIVSIVRFMSKRKFEKRLREAEMQRTILKERERISRDLHDNLGAYAAAIKTHAVYLEKKNEPDAQALNQLKENSEEMVSALRETIWALQHESIHVSALSDRIKKMVHRIQLNFPLIHIEQQEKLETDILLTAAESIQALRIVQEALTNALKHSHATKILISIVSDKNLEIHVKDNGVGFNTSDTGNGYGMTNMRVRAMEVGMELVVESGENGTDICLRK